MRKKKKDDLKELGIDEEEIIDFHEFQEFEKEFEKEVETREDENPEALVRNFIFIIEKGCPICGSDVKGNEYFKYFCGTCNVLFDKKDVLDKEFGKNLRDAIRRRRLTPQEKEEMEKRRKELSEKVRKVFSGEVTKEILDEATDEDKAADLVQKEEVEEAEEEKEGKEEAEDEQEPEEKEEEIEEVEAEIIPPHDTEEEPVEEEEPKGLEESLEEMKKVPHEAPETHEEVEETTEETEDDEETEELDEEAEPEDTEEPDEDEDAEEDDDTEETEKREEYPLETEDKIIASKESTKLHKGTCHFVKKIHPENRIYLNSIEEGEEEGYELCVCLRRLKAMQRQE
jgi:hypothetical protein